MSRLMAAMASLMSIFDDYAGKEGNKDTLTKAEVKSLIENELPGVLKGAKNQDKLNEFFKALDHDGSGEVDFTEFIMLVASITCICHERPCKK